MKLPFLLTQRHSYREMLLASLKIFLKLFYIYAYIYCKFLHSSYENKIWYQAGHVAFYLAFALANKSWTFLQSIHTNLGHSY